MPRKAAPRTLISGDDLELVRRVVEALSALRGHRDDVLDPNAEAPGEINAGLRLPRSHCHKRDDIPSGKIFRSSDE
jgi:hypothetical protein